MYNLQGIKVKDENEIINGLKLKHYKQWNMYGIYVYEQQQIKKKRKNLNK